MARKAQMDKESAQIEFLKTLASACLESLEEEVQRGLKYKILDPTDLITLTIRIGAPGHPDGMEFITTRPAHHANKPPTPPTGTDPAA